MSCAKGDRVRVTIEGVGRAADQGGLVILGLGWVPTESSDFETRVTVERLPPPPEPLYVNAPGITAPEPGDVVRNALEVDRLLPPGEPREYYEDEPAPGPRRSGYGREVQP